LEDFPSAVGGSVVHDDDLMGHPAESQLQVKVLDGGGDTSLLIPRGNDDGEEAKGRHGDCGGWRVKRAGGG
jgi:hypothetical protein